MPVIPKTFDVELPRFEVNPNDLFVTPQAAADYTCEAVKKLTKIEPKLILDPGCGTGVWGRAARKTFGVATMLTGVDIVNGMNEHEDDFHAPSPYTHYFKDLDYTSIPSEYMLPYDAVLGNPPYSSKEDRNLAEKFLMKSLQLVRPGGVVGLLLKTEYIASLRRYENIYRHIRPQYMIQYVPRIKWDGFKFNNTIEYAFFIWKKGETARTQLYWLNWHTGELI